MSLSYSPSLSLVRCLAVAAALTGSGCANYEPKFGTDEQRTARLSGEWISPTNPNHYLVFKPDPTEAREGRVLGLDPFQTYRITYFSPNSPRMSLELISRDAFWEEHKSSASVIYAENGRDLTLVLPPSATGFRSDRRTYRHSTRF